MENKRIRFIDIAKGIAIICIILGHLGNAQINRVVFTFHVPIFFLITGYFTSTKKNLKDFIINKFQSLIIPYFVTCLLIIILGTLKGWINGDAIGAFKRWSFASIYGAGDSYKEPFYIPAIGALWFLWATFWGSLFLKISLKFKYYIRMIFIVGLFMIGYYSREICWFPLSIQAGACATLFMYIGYLFKEDKGIIDHLSKEIKVALIILASFTWYFFVRDFKSFWLVHCDIGRGVVDIIGCICACVMVMLISKLIDSKTNYISRFLAYYGKYSLLVLCVHITELNLFPWWQLAGKLVNHGMPASLQLYFIIVSKLILDLGIAYILSKNNFVKRLFKMKS